MTLHKSSALELFLKFSKYTIFYEILLLLEFFNKKHIT